MVKTKVSFFYARVLRISAGTEAKPTALELNKFLSPSLSEVPFSYPAF
jgi:hypothetical protein